MREQIKAPIDASACDEAWITFRRELVQRTGQALRAGAGRTIEIKSLTDKDVLAAVRLNEWGPIALPNEAPCFVNDAQRDLVLRKLQGAR